MLAHRHVSEVPTSTTAGNAGAQLVHQSDRVIVRERRDRHSDQHGPAYRTAALAQSRRFQRSHSVTALAASGQFLMAAGGQISMTVNT
jgi:hypothetical protein